MTDGLKEKFCQQLIGILRSNKRVEKVVLFGSRAVGTSSPTSDVDLCLFGDELILADQARLVREIEELTIPQHVDLVLHRTIKKEALLEHIRREGKVWFTTAQGEKTD